MQALGRVVDIDFNHSSLRLRGDPKAFTRRETDLLVEALSVGGGVDLPGQSALSSLKEGQCWTQSSLSSECRIFQMCIHTL